jgi:hypothetical protein
MDKLIEDTIAKIKNKHIVPEAKWKYLLRRYGAWLLFVLVVLLGAIAFSGAIYNLSSLDWDLYHFMHQNAFTYSLSIFPYFWSIILAIFVLAAFADIRKTETGYRFSWLKIISITIGGVALLGGLMFYFGFGRSFNNMMNNGAPYLGQHMMVTKESQWSNPAVGLLSGTIVSASVEKLALTDLQGKKWTIFLNDKTLVRPKANTAVGQMIKIIGSRLDEKNFEALEIRPWVGMGQGMMNGGGMGRGGMMR